MFKTAGLDCQNDYQYFQLNSTLKGQLRQAEPLVEPCYSDPVGQECSALKASIATPFFRASDYQGFQYLQDEACISKPSDQCALDPVNLTVPASAQCGQGLVSSYYVEVTGAQDIQAVFDYAQRYNTTLSIKNSGHDYGMRSSRQGSLALWTRQLQEKAFHSTFTPDGCVVGASGNTSHALTFGAGVNTDEAISFAHEHDVVFSAGSANSLGASGGWLLNGGHSAVSNTYGLAVDRVLQFTIVTPDGQVRTVNKCSNPDLFWALRGSGGGTYGVVLNSTFIAEPESPLTVAMMTFPGTDDNQRPFVEILAENMPSWALAGWGGPSGTNLSILNNPNMDLPDAKVMLAPALEYVEKQGGNAQLQSYTSYFDYYVQIINGTFATPSPVSTATWVTSRIIPETIFHNNASREKMVDAIFETAAAGVEPLFLATTPFLYGHNNEDAANSTSIHPAWYESVWHVVVSGVQFSESAPLSERKETISLLRNITGKWVAVAPQGCTYPNEADPWLENWSSEFWGENYPKLLEIKRHIDPSNLLSCWHCVGWDETLPDYGCIADLRPDNHSTRR
ncbi:FAD-linked oxidoreductase [Lachnellula willkommii]|uniref:FAD-linked oxidoreductase n=1 Tax=Lachnellula willkommii TaxID=215461 RepID=A0A559MBG7_9HELO|nr:FAD-linked oxidoreductase [Lachnellula willkommii]